VQPAASPAKVQGVWRSRDARSTSAASSSTAPASCCGEELSVATASCAARGLCAWRPCVQHGHAMFGAVFFGTIEPDKALALDRSARASAAGQQLTLWDAQCKNNPAYALARTCRHRARRLSSKKPLGTSSSRPRARRSTKFTKISRFLALPFAKAVWCLPAMLFCGPGQAPCLAVWQAICCGSGQKPCAEWCRMCAYPLKCMCLRGPQA